MTLPAHSDLAPTYSRSPKSESRNVIVHFGMGNFHRAHQAAYLDELLRQHDDDVPEWGICGVGVLERDRRMHDALHAQDCMYTLVLKAPDGSYDARVIGSIMDHMLAVDDTQAVLDVLAAPSTRIVSLTITEGGYPIDDATGEFAPDDAAREDGQSPQSPHTPFGLIVEALRERRERGIEPFTVLSCDNLPGNGHIAHDSACGQAALSDQKLAQWIDDNVAFPNCMVDRITPVTTDEDRELVEQQWGIEDAWPVGAEPFIQWVIEDKFPAGRPQWEEVGAQMVTDVVPYELMKLRLLNAAHQMLAHWGRLLGMTYAHEAAEDPDIEAVTRAYLEREALPTLRPVPGIDLDQYVDTLFERFTNHAIADTLNRLAEDASDRVPKFVLPALRGCIEQGRPVDLGAAMCAAWALTLEGNDEDGAPITINDQYRDRLISLAQQQKAGNARALLSDARLFGELESTSEFADRFEHWLHAIRRDGARAVMRELIAQAN